MLIKIWANKRAFLRQLSAIGTSLKWCHLSSLIDAEDEESWDHQVEDSQNRPKRPPPKVTIENQYSWIASKVNPFITLPYSEQIRWKYMMHREILLKLGEIVKSADKARLLPCQYDGVVPSPRIYGYRNKDNFHVGVGVDGDPRTVGQIVGSSSRQEVYTVSTELLVSSPKCHKETLKVLQDFVRSVQIPPQFTRCNFFWQDGFIRSNRAGDVALSLCLNPKGLTLSDIQREKQRCVDFFSTESGSRIGLHSLHIKTSTFSCYGKEPFELVLGNEHLNETLLNRQFRISPDAFFQVNPSGAEVLYSHVRKLATRNIDASQWTLLDACCGTGTIGVLLSDLFGQVIGFDIEESAVADARKNAATNGITNARYYTGPAKSCLKYLSSRGLFDSDLSAEKHIVAVVNPSRSGLSNSVMNDLRAVPAIKRIVYVSCNPGGRCLNNFEVLCRSKRAYLAGSETSSSLKGLPFVPSLAVSVDMFPHTHHCEMVIVFDRD